MNQTDQQIVRRMIQQEVAKSKQQGRFNLNVNPNIRHTGLDSFKINANNIAGGGSTSGSVTFSNTGVFTFNTNFTPKHITFYGTIADGVTNGTGYRSLTVGEAALGQNLYFQPSTTSSVKTGGTLGIIQSCSSIVINGGGTGVLHYAPIGEGHIIDVWSTNKNSPEARATVSGYSANSFTITVNTLASGYSIVGNYFVS